MNSEKVVVAEILRTRGIKGEVVVRSQTDVPGRLEGLQQAQVDLADGSTIELAITAAWKHKGEWVLKFAGWDSIETAERLRGLDLWVRREERAALADGEYYLSDLIGCRLEERATGKTVGTVEAWQDYGSVPLMEVQGVERRHLVPFVRQLCQVDLQARTISAELPEGVLDL